MQLKLISITINANFIGFSFALNPCFFHAMQLGKRFIFFHQIFSKPFSICMQSHMCVHKISLLSYCAKPFPFASGTLSFFYICIWNRCYLFEYMWEFISFSSRLWTLMSLNNIMFVRIATIESSFPPIFAIYHSIISHPVSISVPSDVNKKCIFIEFYLLYHLNWIKV